MRVRPVLATLAALTVLAACEPPIPDSGAVVRGPGFETPAQIAAREAALRRNPLTPAQTVLPPDSPPGSSAVVVSGRTMPASEAEQLAADTRAVLGVPAPQAPVTVPSQTAEAPEPLPAPAPLPDTATAAVELDRDNPGLSREQDFAAVAAQRSIEADAARVNAARQQFQVVQPRELERPDEVGPNIVSYALERARPVGASGSFRRSLTASERAAARRCQGYRTDDVAQEEFLSAGGPERDRLGLDPDGDGNACDWDPATFRSLIRN
ncbi:hypothetical protein [Jannaschia seohaensis]|uniref:Excalibur calcium-binding domain-containing protein n=1 Tax=Jannaschia seohaensis TaxID=475081 RepID=A0A2Y9C1Q5_9RHOB|nr:hypothetical protein [Jannaschia seohaensis]PWJ17025.1 hypothetical protein BCF38_107139 [Jannaschia seohaensis]SSA48362.1 hypothetical protein SAMN05421539_107139 [Jannaschia seohaensis]